MHLSALEGSCRKWFPLGAHSRWNESKKALGPRPKFADESSVNPSVKPPTMNSRKRQPSSQDLEVADQSFERSHPIANESIAMITRPGGQIAEQFRSLRNSISALNPDGAPRTVVVTSSLRGEGKTVACLNLGVAMTELPGTHVLIVGADLHRPMVEEYLGLPQRQGLTELLRGTCSIDQAIRQTSIPNLSILAPGALPTNPSELLGSDRMRTVLNSLKQRYSYVLVDTPDALSTNDAGLLGSMADGILLVVRLGHTPRYYVEQTNNALEALGGNVLGTCLTGANITDTSSHYPKQR